MTANTGVSRLLIALALLAVWAAITVQGGLMQAGQGSLGELVSRQIVWATPLAALFLLVSARLLGWKDLGLNAPRPASSVRLFWLLGLYIAALGLLAILTKDIVPATFLIIAINTFFVGFSEELAFRGVLWGAARKVMPFWVGAVFVSAIFGSVHLLNAFITGELGQAGFQSFSAFLSGLAYIALRVRTRSIIPIFVAHWLWDLVVFLNASAVQQPAVAQAGEGQSPMLVVYMILPLTLYGLWLLRKRAFQHMTDEIEPGQGPAAPASQPKG